MSPNGRDRAMRKQINFWLRIAALTHLEVSPMFSDEKFASFINTPVQRVVNTYDVIPDFPISPKTNFASLNWFLRIKVI
jgi:hypothetical protein